MQESNEKGMAVHGGEVFRLASLSGIEPDTIIDFSANINPLGLPPGVDLALRQALQNLSNYPEIDAVTLRSKVADRHQLPIDSVIVGNGSSALIYLLARALKPKKSLIWSPTFSEYERALKQVQSEVVNLNCLNPEKSISLDEIIAATVKAEPELVFLCNPNNPTGALLSIDELEKIVSIFKKAGIILVLDEAFIDFVGGESSFVSRLDEFDNIIILRSLTKIYALAGIRCGYLVSCPEINRLLSPFLEPWSVNSLALRAATAALENDAEFIKQTISFIAGERQYLSKKFAQLKYLKSYPASANYILAQVDQNIDCGDLRDFLFIRDKIMIRLCDDYVGLGSNFVRFAVKKESENRTLVKGLSEFQTRLEG